MNNTKTRLIFLIFCAITINTQKIFSQCYNVSLFAAYHTGIHVNIFDHLDKNGNMTQFIKPSFFTGPTIVVLVNNVWLESSFYYDYGKTPILFKNNRQPLNGIYSFYSNETYRFPLRAGFKLPIRLPRQNFFSIYYYVGGSINYNKNSGLYFQKNIIGYTPITNEKVDSINYEIAYNKYNKINFNYENGIEFSLWTSKFIWGLRVFYSGGLKVIEKNEATYFFTKSSTIENEITYSKDNHFGIFIGIKYFIIQTKNEVKFL